MFLSLLVRYDSVTGNVIPEIGILDALIYAIVGFVVTFIGIAILIFFIWAVCKLLKKAEGVKIGKKKQAPEEAAVLPSADSADELDEKVRVAIVAAIAAYYAAENSHCEFKVKRIKRL